MASLARRLAVSVAAVCLALTLGAAPAEAAHAKHHAKKHHVHHSKAAKGSSIVRIAQQHLANLGYYSGSVDGVMGPQTKAAIKTFQREHGLKADGVLGKKTNLALEVADHRVVGTRSMFLSRSPLTGVEAEVDQTYAASLNGGTKAISSRYARVDVSESGRGASKRYEVKLNGQPVLSADGQPSIINVSPTYELGGEDALVLTSYSPDDSGCIYRNRVLVMDGAGSKLLDIDNCTRDFKAWVENGSLFVTFQESDVERAFGSTWRLEGANLVKL